MSAMSTFNSTFPIMPIPSLPNLMAVGGNNYPLYAGLPVFPGMQIGSFADALTPSAFTPAKAAERALYSQSELDMLLYGYAKSKTPGSSHALSGLSLSDLKYGLEKIGVAGSKQNKHTVVEESALPEGVVIQQLTFAGIQHSSAFTTKSFEKGHKFGPFQGKNVYTSEIKTHDGNSYMWEIFKDGKLKYFIDGRGSTGNWMAYVNCARYFQEQNLDAVQIGEEIYYQTTKDIPEGKELLVWYGDTYQMFMGIPISLKADDVSEETKQSNIQAANDSNGYSCERCGKVFAYKYYKDKHLKYTRCVDQGDRKFPCTLCTRSFEKRDRLRIHILHVHEKHRPHKCSVCSKCFSQSSSLNKHMRVHSGERPYKCVYCNKAFTASSILRTHIRQHSGEKPFKCKFCGKAFASHAAHDSHVRRTHTKDKTEQPVSVDSLKCKICQQLFSQDFELTFHMNHHHPQTGAPISECSTCGQCFNTQYDLYLHSTVCLASPHPSSPSDSSVSDESFTGSVAPSQKDEIDVVG